MEKEIKKRFEKEKVTYFEHATIKGKIIATVGAYNNGLGKVMHMMRDHYLHFHAQCIIILVSDDSSGRLIEDVFMTIPFQEIINIKVKSHVVNLLLTIQTKRGDIVYKISKNIFACGWHKENLAFLLLRFQK